ncbi:recombinase family protein [Patescibacteria group bacterium]|nr:recombinase family protein [Patescibacteria group bacterium]
MLTCAIYARVSSREQLEGYSIDTQLELLRKYAKEHKYSIYDEYVERGKSGTSLNRPELIRLVKDADNKAFDMVLSLRIDRLFRNNLDRRKLEEKLKKKSITVVYIHEPDDPKTASGKLSRGIKGEFAEYFSNWLSENVARGKRKRAELGLCSSNPPYGYRLNKGKYEVVESEAEVVRRIFDLYRTMGIRPIVDELKGIKSPSGNEQWGQTTIRRLVSNPAYVGDSYYRRWKFERVYVDDWMKKTRITEQEPELIVSNTHEAIIDRKTFEETQKIMETRRFNGVRKPLSEFWLLGIAYCAHCNDRMIANRRRRPEGLIEKAYRCRNKACEGNYINMGKLHESVIGELDKRLKNVDFKEEIKRYKPPRKIIAKHGRVKKEIEKNLQSQDKLFKLHYKKAITIEQFRKQNNNLLDELKGLNKLLEEVQQGEPPRVSSEEVMQRLRNLRTLIEKAEHKRDLFSQIFDKVFVHRSPQRFKKNIMRKIVVKYIK